MRVTKVNSLVSYGSKVAGIVPGSFTEIYHFSQQANWSADGKGTKRFVAMMDSIGDEFAKSPLLSNFVKELDFTDKLFYEVWKEAIDAAQGKVKESATENPVSNPFSQPQPSKWKV